MSKTTLSAALEARDKATPGPWEQDGWSICGYPDTPIFHGAKIADIIPWDVTGCRREDNANMALLFAAPDALDWIAKAFPFMKLDLERRRFADYDDGENRAYGDRDIATLTALIAQAEGTEGRDV